MKKFLPFGLFAPDAPDRDSPHLEVVACVLPWAGEYRPMDALSEVTREGTAGSAINGSIAHMVTEGAAKQHARPTSTPLDSGFVGIDTDGEEVAHFSEHLTVDEPVPDDNDYATWNTDDNGTATIRFDLNDVPDPLTANPYYVRARFRFNRAPNDYELVINLKQSGTIVDPGADPCTWTYDENNYVTGVWYEVAELLTDAQANAITNDGTNHDNLTLEFIATLAAITGGPDTQEASPDDDDNNTDAWERSSDDSTDDIYTMIDDGSPIASYDSDYISTPELSLGESVSYTCDVSTVADPRVDDEHTVFYRYSGSGTDLTVSLLEEVGGSDVLITSRTHEGVTAASATTDSFGYQYTALAVLVFDDSGSSYADETDNAKDFATANADLLPATPAVDDIIYVAADFKFGKVHFDIDTGSGGSTDINIDWKVWKGSAWGAPGSLVDETDELDVSGDVRYAAPLDWETTTIDGEGPYYYLRGIVSSVPGTPTQPVANSVTVLGVDAGTNIEDYKNLKLKFDFTAAGFAGAEQQTRPTADVSLGLWTDKSGGTSNIYQSIDEATPSDTDYVTSTQTTTNPKFRFEVGSQDEPSDHTVTKLTFRVKQTGGPRPDIIVRIVSAEDQEFDHKFKDLTTTWTNRVWNLDPEESRALGWGSDFVVEIEKKTTGNTSEVRCSWMEMESASGASRGRIYNAYMQTPEAYGADVSYTELEVPDTTVYTQPDNIVIYAGNEDYLYHVDPTGFTDYSVAAGYNAGSVEPASWSFCSWGDDCIATNYEDPVQIFDTSAPGSPPTFVNLITEPSSNPPQAKYCAVVSQFLVLGNLTNRTGYGEYSIWWSAINNPAEFYEGDLTTQSDYQHLRDTPGSITGIVGGSDLGLVFKAGYIYQMVYVGPPLIFAFHVLSRGQGTTYPKSIVAVGQDIYFLGNGGFYVLRGGTQLDPIGDGAITKMFLDAAYGEPRAMAPEDTESVISKEGHVIGSFDPFSGLIFWAYRDAASTALQNNMVLVYNPKENAWSWCGDVGELDLLLSAPVASATWSSAISDIVSIPSLHNPDTSLLKTTGFFEWYPTDDDVIYKKSQSSQPFDVVLKTKILSVAFMLQSESALGRDFYLRSVKPAVRGEPTTTDPDVEIVVSASDDLLMLAANTNSETLTKAKRNTDGWYVLADRLEGEYWRFEIRVHSALGANVENLSGLAINYEMAGEV